MRSAHTNIRSRAQRARRDAEREMREPAPCYPPHGEVIGSIMFILHGREVCAELLSTGKHCRTHGVRIEGRVVGVMGADMAWREVSRLMPRMMSIRSL